MKAAQANAQRDAQDFAAMDAKRGEPAPETLQAVHAATYGLESLLPNTAAQKPYVGTPPLGSPWISQTPKGPPTPLEMERILKDFVMAEAPKASPAPAVTEDREVSLPDAAKAREEFPMATGLLDYFPNALAEVSRLSYLATQQHHPDAPMHWDRAKSPDHRNKILRHLVDAGKLDDRGIRHSAGLAWRALANLQVELEAAYGHPLPRACRPVA